jgi:hypothetical protein
LKSINLYKEQPGRKPGVFLGNPFYFWVTLSVLFTTIFSWFRINSFAIVLCTACAIWHCRPLTFLKLIFANRPFLAFLLFALVETAGLLHTRHLPAGLDVVSKDGTLVAMGCVLCTGRFAGQREYGKLMWAYCGIVFLACVYCLVRALLQYKIAGDASVFFYHSLTSWISQNAVFFSVYVLFGIIFLLSPCAESSFQLAPPRWQKKLRFLCGIFFIGMIVLLSSKLFLLLTLLLVVFSLTGNWGFRGRRWSPVALAAGLVVVTAGIFLTNNPVSARYRELMQANTDILRQPKFSPGMYFNAIQLRLLEWRFAEEILRDHPGSWLYGVSPGDSQFLLDQKYKEANMYVGNPADGPNRKVRGFLGYNFHNQFLETEVRDGAVGLISLSAIFVLLAGTARRYRSRTMYFVVITLLLFFIPEAPLTLQQGVFLFCFFPLVAPYGEKNVKLQPE